MFSAIETVVKRDDWIFAQDGAQSHQSHSVQDFAEECSILTWFESTGLILLGLR